MDNHTSWSIRHLIFMTNLDSRIVTNFISTSKPSINLPINQPINQSIKQGSNESINQPINHSFSVILHHKIHFSRFFTLTPKHLSTGITLIKPWPFKDILSPKSSRTVGTSTIFSVISSKCRGTFPPRKSGWILIPTGVCRPMDGPIW